MDNIYLLSTVDLPTILCSFCSKLFNCLFIVVILSFLLFSSTFQPTYDEAIVFGYVKVSLLQGMSILFILPSREPSHFNYIRLMFYRQFFFFLLLLVFPTAGFDDTALKRPTRVITTSLTFLLFFFSFFVGKKKNTKIRPILFLVGLVLKLNKSLMECLLRPQMVMEIVMKFFCDALWRRQ